jgi:hypothetical protein
MVPKPKDKFMIMKKMHNEIGHFGGARMLVEIKKGFFGMIGQTLSKSLSRFVIDANWPNKLAI